MDGRCAQKWYETAIWLQLSSDDVEYVVVWIDGAHHAVALVLDGANERGEVRQAAADDALVLGLRGADARELELLHARRQRQLSCAQPCAPHDTSVPQIY